MKKVFKWLGITIGAIIFIIIAASIIIMLIVDEKMIASQMEKALNRHVTLKELNIGIFAVASGIEVKEVYISNYKTKKQLEALKDKPVPKSDLFVGLKAFNFKLKFLPLFTGKFILDELALYEPAINVIKYKSGAFNFSDLVKPGAKEAEPLKEVEVEKAEKGKPFTADNLPVEITIGKIGMENGNLKYVDEGLGQTFQVYDLTTLVHSIKIDPKDLENKDSVGLKLKMGVKTIGTVKSGSVKSFDIGFDIDGQIIPFDKKTRLANPEIDLKMGLPYGNMTGLQIFESAKSVEQLTKYCGKLDFLKDSIKWKNAYVNVWYKNNVVKLKDGKIPTDDYVLNYSGETNIKSKAVNISMDMLLADKHTKSVRSGIQKNVSKAKTGKAAKYVDTEKITDAAMKRITTNDKVELGYLVKGTLSDPDTKLIKPALPSLTDIIKESLGDMKDVAAEKAKEQGKVLADKAKNEAAKKAEDKLKKKIDKKKFGF